jgi:DNA-binding transcriptional regulator YiaG
LDVTGELLFKPEAVRFLDRVRVLAMRVPKSPTPGFILTLREALGLTQVEYAARLGVDSMTVSRWERGAIKPGPAAIRALDKLRRESARRGVVIAA